MREHIKRAKEDRFLIVMSKQRTPMARASNMSRPNLIPATPGTAATPGTPRNIKHLSGTTENSKKKKTPKLIQPK